MCVSTDGLIDGLRVMSVQQIYDAAVQLFCRYEMTKHLNAMARLSDYTLTEHQFAQLIGKTRLYQFLPSNERRALPSMEFTDSHINAIARAYYADENFACADDRSIDLWRVYNLFTGANKSSYIDTFLSRARNATTFTHGLTRALDGDEQYRWFVE